MQERLGSLIVPMTSGASLSEMSLKGETQICEKWNGKITWTDPAGKVRHEYGKNCANDKHFRAHIKNCEIGTWIIPPNTKEAV